MYEPTHCLSWTSLPYGTCQRGGVHDGDASGAAASHVQGLATPFAAFTTRSCDRRLLSKSRAYRHHEGVGAPMGFLLQGFPLGHDWCFSRSPCLHAGSTRRSPIRGWRPRRAAACKAFVPAPSPYAMARPGTNPKPLPSAVPFLEFRSLLSMSHRATGSRFDRGASLHALRQGDVPVYRGPKVSGTHGVAGPSRDLQLT